MAEFKALIFDCDGVIAETEADGHRVAFNRVFQEEGLGVDWDMDTYGEKLKIAGGKERMVSIFSDSRCKIKVDDVDAYIKKLHQRKTDLYMEIIERGELPGRRGVKRLVEEAHKAGIKLAIASTSNERGVRLIARWVLDDALDFFDVILAGDVVSKKKPDPEIYLLAARILMVQPAECCVVEDTSNGFQAAQSAGMRCVVTRSQYSKNEQFPGADLVVDSLGEEADADMVSIPTIKSFFK
jgi:HAD superfamily hydrolase (TIGR01509 family)